MLRSQDSTERFSSRVADYVTYRPSYPRELIDRLETEIGLRPFHVIADVGSGTGISSELFLTNGNRVIAVEPNAEMRGAAESLLGSHPGFVSQQGRAEETTLRDSSVDVVVCAQAFHWFEASLARAEFVRILRPGGWVVLLWNVRRTAATPFLRDYESLLLKHATDYATVRHDNLKPEDLHAFFQGDVRTLMLPSAQRLDRDGLRGRLLSSSYVPGPGDPGNVEMLRDIDDLFATHESGGSVTIEYDTQVHLGRLQG